VTLATLLLSFSKLAIFGDNMEGMGLNYEFGENTLLSDVPPFKFFSKASLILSI